MLTWPNRSQIVVIVLLVILILIIARATDWGRRRRALPRLANTAEERRAIMSAPGKSPDDHFMKAVVLTRMLDDAQDARDIPATRTLRNLAAREYEEATRAVRGVGAQQFDDEFIMRGAVNFALQHGLPCRIRRLPKPVALPPAKREFRLEWHSDAQNVHDSAVSRTVDDAVRHLLADDPRLISNDECRRALTTAVGHLRDPDARRRATTTIDTAFRSDSRMDRYGGVPEADILRTIFQRSLADENADRADSLRASLVGALVDATEPDSRGAVCSVGRCSRYVSSLEMIDRAPPVPPVAPVDAFRQEIFSAIARVPEAERSPALVKKIMRPYAARLPQHTYAAIETECMAGLE